LDWLYLILIFAFVGISAFFSLAETSFSCLNKYRFQVPAEKGSRLAKTVLWIEGHFESALIAILIAINALAVVLSALSTYLFLRTLPEMNDVFVSLISSLALTLVLYLFGETIPKQIARKIPSKTASLVAYPLFVAMILLYPLTLFFRGLFLLLKIIFRSKKEPSLTEEDFTSVIEANEEEGLIKENESDLIQASFDFSDTVVKDVLTKKEDMFEIDLQGLTNQGLADRLCETKYSRIPMYFGSKDKIVGILLVKEYLTSYLKNPLADIKGSLERPYVIAPTITIGELTDGFRSHHTQIALVYQGAILQGMITMEDVLEELVGPINERAFIAKEKTVRK
jgi:CBS domain containing-hemolysin-like protein